jgi:hypothetical protein
VIDHLAQVGMVMGAGLTLFGVIGRRPRVGPMLLGAFVFGASFWVHVLA